MEGQSPVVTGSELNGHDMIDMNKNGEGREASKSLSHTNSSEELYQSNLNDENQDLTPVQRSRSRKGGSVRSRTAKGINVQENKLRQSTPSKKHSLATKYHD